MEHVAIALREQDIVRHRLLGCIGHVEKIHEDTRLMDREGKPIRTCLVIWNSAEVCAPDGVYDVNMLERLEPQKDQ